jgi:hypothetical protein
MHPRIALKGKRDNSLFIGIRIELRFLRPMHYSSDTCAPA